MFKLSSNNTNPHNANIILIRNEVVIHIRFLKCSCSIKMAEVQKKFFDGEVNVFTMANEKLTLSFITRFFIRRHYGCVKNDLTLSRIKNVSAFV